MVTVLLAEVLASDEDDIDEEEQQYLEKLAKAVSVFVPLPAVVLLWAFPHCCTAGCRESDRCSCEPTIFGWYCLYG